jgi:hypothetical protein
MFFVVANSVVAVQPSTHFYACGFCFIYRRRRSAADWRRASKDTTSASLLSLATRMSSPAES